jgi:hypothetical protein
MSRRINYKVRHMDQAASYSKIVASFALVSYASFPLFKKMKEKNAHPAQGLPMGEADRARLETVGFYVRACELHLGREGDGRGDTRCPRSRTHATQCNAVSLLLRRRQSGSWVERGRGTWVWVWVWCARKLHSAARCWRQARQVQLCRRLARFFALTQRARLLWGCGRVTSTS